jgi:hydrogenase nickel incorporation protein HypB
MNVEQIRVYRDLMGENERWAKDIRSLLVGNGVYMVNLIGSPGSGKTTLLEKMVGPLRGQLRLAVLEGDIETTLDAERLHALDVPVCQLFSGGACHLEAKLVRKALGDFDLRSLDIVFVENVGNMVCPAEFDIGEHAKVAVLSITEGEEKPLKYPLLYREAKAVVLTKTDLLPHLDTELGTFRDHIRQVNADLPVFPVSTVSGEGIEDWLFWVVHQTQET